MKMFTIADREDSLLLRRPSCDLSAEAIDCDTYRTLEEKMIVTVIAEHGVGLAGPQVGLLRRVVAVKRYDKEGEPFEVYPNISITEMRGEFENGPEGCLSVPDCYGFVPRSRDIDIRYTSAKTLRDTVETVQGFTAVIFQHECDHLDGVLYIDKTVDVESYR